MKRALIIAATALVAYLVGCGTSYDVAVERFSPEGEVRNLQTFTVEFTEDLAPPDKQNEWLDEEFIEFDPPIQGRFKWTSPRTLIFSPDQPLDPMREYTAAVTDAVLFGKDLSADFETVEFHTPYFDVVGVDFFWANVPNEYYKLTVQGNIRFNYPVDPDKLKGALEVRKDGEEWKTIDIVSDKPSKVIAVNFGEIKQTKRRQKFEVRVAEGLGSTIEGKPLEETRRFESDLPPITELAITGVASGYDGDRGWIEVSTTQPADEKKLREYVDVEGARNVRFSVSANLFRVEADFGGRDEAKILIKKGLPGLYGGKLEDEFEQTVSLVDIAPSIRFADKKGKYLMYGGERNLALNVVNVEAVDIEVHRVYRNNILHFLNSHSYYYSDYYASSSQSRSYHVGNYGKELYKETKRLSGGRNWLEKVGVNLDKAIKNKEYTGIYVVKAMSSEDRWINDSKMLAASDLGVIAKLGTDELSVFVNSIKSATPVSGVVVSLISETNQTIFEGATDQDGMARFDGVAEKLDRFRPRLVVVEKGNDFNYIDLRETEIETSRFDVGGRYEYAHDYNAFIYGDRNLYRPGETAIVTAIVRDEYLQPTAGEPLNVKVLTPTGATFGEYNVELNRQGSFDLDVPIPDYALTGEYRLELFAAGDKLIGSYRFSVEDFAPDKIRVALTTKDKRNAPGDEVAITADAEFLFGAEAKGLKYEADVQLRHRPYRSEKYDDYDFTNSSIENVQYDKTMMDGTLDDRGEATIEYRVPSDVNGKGVVTGYAYVSVFDLTGRTVNRAISFDVFPRDYYLGVKREGYYYGVNERVPIRLAVVDPLDDPIKKFEATVDLIRYEWRTVLKRDYSGNHYYASEKKAVVVSSKNVTIDGKTTYRVRPKTSGSYELRVRKRGADHYVSTHFYAYGWASASATSFPVDREGRVDIVFDKERYEPGETAKVLFTGPFNGRLLVTVERDGVYTHEYLEMRDKSAETSIPVTDAFMPNVYVTATLFRPHTADVTVPFLVGHGFASMTVERKSNNLPVTIIAPEKTKPRTSRTITVKTKPEANIYVTLAAVDEGILQIKNYETPDPYAFMYAKRSLKTSSYDLYELLLPEVVSMRASTAGDGMFDEQLKKRTNPVKSNRFELLAFWSGVKTTDANGEATMTIELPQFNGEVRLMAVVYSNNRFGSGEARMKVADDLIVEPEVPRFFSIGDTLVNPVTMINTTDDEAEATVKISVEGPLKLLSDNRRSADIGAQSTETVEFTIAATNEIGEGKIIYETTGLAEVKKVIHVGVRPASPLVSETESGTIRSGETKNIPAPSGFLAGTRSATLTISKFPAVQFAEHLKGLVGYPYGCLEQTISRSFPQLYFADLAKLVAPDLYRTNNPNYYVRRGVRKVESMQLYDGSMAYWQGGTYSSWWGSIYAAHFLLEAKKAGYDVSKDVLDKLLAYVARQAREPKTYDYAVYENNSRHVRKRARKEILYSLYVLALAGKADDATMNYYKARPHLLTTDGTYLLAAAYALAGKWNTYYAIAPRTFEAEKPVRETGGTFDSEIRANALMLGVLLDVHPANEQIPLMIKHLSQNADKMRSTQERAFFFLAMGKAARRSEGENLKVKIAADGKTIETYDGKDLSTSSEKLFSGAVTLTASGKGEVYYFWSVEGIKLDEPVKEEDAFMRVRREFVDYRTGSPIRDNNFYQGQLVVCKLTLNGFGRSAENVVIADLVPAGFEIENPRLENTDRAAASIKNPMTVDYLDIRDDRVLVFTELPATGEREYAYLARVVNKGTFKLPAIAAEAMYDPEFRSYHGAGTATVRERQSVFSAGPERAPAEATEEAAGARP